MLNKKKRIIISIVVIVVILIVVICLYIASINKNVEINNQSSNIIVEYEEDEISGDWDDTYTSNIKLSDAGTTVDGGGVIVSNNTITIKSAGTYYITGSISDGNIIVNANNAEVQLVLSNVSITSKTTAPINVVKAGKVTITLEEDTTTYIKDSSSYTVLTSIEDEEPNAAIFSKSDLVINGKGTLNVESNYLDGIASKDTLKIINANIIVTAKDDGIRGKDYVAINGATIQINSESDGIKSTNTTDASLGYIIIEDSNIKITSGNDGIQAETVLNIQTSTIDIKTEGEIQTHSDSNGFGMMGGNTTSSSTDTESSKGIKAGTEITIKSGDITIDSTDDSIHSNGSIIINGGNMNLSSGDDGIHADTNISITGGTINITKSYEGIESAYIEISGGKISVVASDDGINVAGGNDSSSTDGRTGQNNFSDVGSSNRKLVISGGEINVSANGDGLDSNGSIYMSGGTVIVAGPTSGGNGILDFDNTFEITEGTLIAYGGSGMLQTPSTSSTQYTIVASETGSSGDRISLKDSSGNEIVNTETVKSYSVVMISSPNLKQGSSYTIYKNGNQSTAITVNSIVTTTTGITTNNTGMPGGQQNNNKRK